MSSRAFPADAGPAAPGRLRLAPATAWFLFLLPHFTVPAGAPYRPPAAGIFLLLWAIFAVLRNRTVRLRMNDATGLRPLQYMFFGYCLLSVGHGYLLLSESNRQVLHLTGGDVHYLQPAFERLLQLSLALLTLEILRTSRFAPAQMMRWWLNGTVFAVLLHLLTHVITDSDASRRAGTFPEGNVAGLYYLLSIFVALEYLRAGASPGRLCYLACAVAGVFLSRSTAAIVLMALLIALRYALATRHVWQRGFRSLLMGVTVLGVGGTLIARGLDFGIGEKLFEQEVTAASFSRIDRLASIEAAFELFKASPVLGNGLQSYGFLSNELMSAPLQAVYDNSYQRIPNNIYLEILSELGILGMMIFGLMLVRFLVIGWQAGRANLHNYFCGLLGVLLYWNAFPTYTVLFVWAFLGLILAAWRQPRRLRLDPRAAVAPPAGSVWPAPTATRPPPTA